MFVPGDFWPEHADQVSGTAGFIGQVKDTVKTARDAPDAVKVIFSDEPDGVPLYVNKPSFPCIHNRFLDRDEVKMLS